MTTDTPKAGGGAEAAMDAAFGWMSAERRQQAETDVRRYLTRAPSPAPIATGGEVEEAIVLARAEANLLRWGGVGESARMPTKRELQAAKVIDDLVARLERATSPTRFGDGELRERLAHELRKLDRRVQPLEFSQLHPEQQEKWLEDADLLLALPRTVAIRAALRASDAGVGRLLAATENCAA